MPQKPIKYSFLSHPADIKIYAIGKDLPELFANSALGMMDYIYNSKAVTVVDRHELVSVTAEDLESLLVNWLAELLALTDINDRIYLDYRVMELGDKKIVVAVGSGKAKAKREIKAVTYHELQLIQTADGWSSEIVYDI